MAAAKDIEDLYPLSPVQEGLLFHCLAPGEAVYVTQLTCQLRGLVPAAFASAFRTVVDRHPALRSAFVWKSTSQPLQVVARRAALPVHTEDWRGLDAAHAAARLDAFLLDDRRRELRLARAPLMRLALFRTGEDLHQLVWTFSHLILDGWCRSLVLQEVFTLYEAYRQGSDAALPPVRPYRDYIAWLQEQDLAEVEAFWRRQLAGLAERTPVHALPTGAGEGAGEREIAMPAGAVNELRALAQRHRLTPGTVVHGAWAILLSRYSGQPDVVFGTVVAGRPPELAGAGTMVGTFSNTLPVRARIAGDIGAAAWLRSLQAELVEQRRYEHSPLAQVQRWSGLPAGQPLFDSLLAFQSYPLAQPSPGLGIAAVRWFEGATYPLTLTVVPETAWRLQLGFDRGRFSAAAVTRMLRHFLGLLEALAEDAERRPWDLPMLSAGEQAQLLREWNDTAAHLPACRVVELFELRARAAPDRPAVVWERGVLSFGGLERRASRLACRLRLLGVGAGSVVGLAAERSPELLEGMLGVLKAGAAFLPLDLASPGERLQFMLADAGARLVLTQGSGAAALAGRGPRQLALDGDWQAVLRPSEPSPAGTGDPAGLAYVIYTSGSTGLPKGVAVTHRALAAFALEIGARLRLGAGDRMLQFASPAFDVLLEEVFPIWLRGGAVVLLPPEVLGSPRELGAAMDALGVTVAELPAVYWHQWVDQLVSDGASPPHGLRLLLLGAEKPAAERLTAWARFQVPLVHVFGLTETTVTSVLHEVPAGQDGELPIGRPVANTRLYVLDRAGRPAPAGVPGELHIGGAGLAQGYLGRPALTAERFVPDPWSGGTGERLYRTGDLVLYRVDGQVEFLGRLDQQVKVRGCRIELGEIEERLRCHPGVRDAVAMVREDRPGDRRLVAYVVAAGPAAPEARELRAFLAQSLPEPMLPAAFAAIASVPVTVNGKVDRRALPPPGPAAAPDGSGFAAPRTVAERLLAEIWRSVLGLERVGVHDNFFELGGDSILGIRVAAAAQRRGRDLAPWQLFKHPTIARLAVALAPARDARPAPAPPPAGPVPLTPIQLWFFELALERPGHWNLPLLLALRGPWSPVAVAAVMARLVERHDALRLRFLREGGGWRQEVAAAAPPPPVPRVDLAALPAGARRGALAAAAGALQVGFDLARPPLLRLVWFDLGPAGRRLLLAAHHLVVDGVSWHILAEELETGCGQLLGGQPLALPPATAPFARWAERLAQHARSAAVAAELDTWLARLPRGLLRLPVDVPAGANAESGARSLTVGLDEEETRALLQEAPRTYRTRIDDLLLTALARAFRDWTGSGRVFLDLEGHGREELFADLDLARTVGWFTTLTPVCLELPDGDDLGRELRSIKEQLRSVPGGGIGYGLLRHLGGGEAAAALRDLPRPEALFNYLGRTGAPAAPAARLSLALADEPTGAAAHPGAARTHLLEVNARVAEGSLEVRWTYGSRRHHRSTIAALAEGFAAHLRALVAHCRRAPRAFTRSDFPLAGLDEGALAQVVGAAGHAVEDLYPLSPLQQGMLFHCLFEPGEGAYVAQFVFELGKEVDLPALQAAWQELLQRHPVLRTAFLWEGLDAPLQVVLERVPLPWQEEDLRRLAPAAQERHLQRCLRADRSRGFDSARAPLLRLLLLRRDAGCAWLVLSLHQMVLDGWSLPLLFEDLFALYDGARRGEDARLDRRPPYRDYIAWLRGQTAGQAEAYWRRTLAGFAPPAPLILEPAAGEPLPGGHGEAQGKLEVSATQALLALARRHEVTLNGVAQGIWALLLSRYSGEEDVVFGCTVAGRPAELPGAEAMVGLLINTLPVRVRVPGEARLSGWLRELQDRQAEMHRYEHSSLVDVQRWWSGAAGGQPLFESLVVFQNYPLHTALGARGESWGIRGVESREQTNYPLTVVLRPEAALAVTLSFSRRCCGEAAARRMVGHLLALLAGCAAGADPRLAELPMLHEAERHQLLWEWNDAGEAAGGGLLHRLFEEQAGRTPEAVAVACGGQQVSYGELERRANRLAWELIGRGAGPEVVVGICLERSVEMVCAILGVLKTGGAYLPLDPDHPRRRLAAVLGEARIGIVVAGGEAADGPAMAGLEAVRLDGRLEALAHRGAGSPAVAVDAASAAYVIYTSGSTGNPKGAINSHGAICNRILWAREACGLTAADRVLQKTPLGFDVSVWELFWPLSTGARLELARPGGHRETGYLRETIRDLGITHVHFVPSLLQAFLEEERLEECAALRQVVCSGEALSPGLQARFFERLGAGVELHNLYGPTEAAVEVTAWRCRAGGAAQAVPIGRPIAGVRIRLLDRHGEMVPAGVPGELHIGGRAPARGYLHRPGLTAERFVPDGFGAVPGGRLYRTGDLARYRPDAAIEFLGRIDSQVKVRGFRVEPGEIEAVLGQHPEVREAAVVAREERPGRSVLAAYVVAHRPPGPRPRELRGFLEERLPAPMVPAVYVALEALPLSPNGKLDRRALPALAAPDLGAAAGFAAASSPVERQLAAIWAETLGLERVGIHDNFFELGGDSIQSLLVVTRAARAGLKLTPKQLFEHPTIARLAVETEAAPPPAAEQGAVAGEVPLTPIQRWFLEQEQPEAHHFNQTVLLEVRQRLEPRHLHRVVAALLAHHDALRLRFARHGSGWRQTNAAAEGRRCCSWIDLIALPGDCRERAARAAAESLQASLDLAHGPLLRVAVLRLDPGACDRLLLTAHHLAVDAVSWRILLDDLASWYRQASLGEPLQRPAKTTSFQRWAERLAGGADLVRAELDYWLAPPRANAPRLPVDSGEGANTAGSCRSVWVALPEAETAALGESAAAAYGARMQEVLLTALAQAVAAWLHAGAVLIDVEGHGREELFDGVDLSRTVGWFTSIFPLLLEVDAEAAPGKALQAVKEQLRCVPGRGIGYGMLRYLDGRETADRLRGLPDAEVAFNYLGQLDRGHDAAALFTLSPGIAGAVSPRTVRRHLITVDGHIASGSLAVEWTFSENRFDRTTIQRLADAFLARLRAILDHCRSPAAEGYTPSDFGLARLEQRQLDRLAQKYGRQGA